MYINSSSRVAVLDLTHGGIVLSRKLKKLVRSVTAIDVYNTITEVLDELENEGITTAHRSPDL